MPFCGAKEKRSDVPHRFQPAKSKQCQWFLLEAIGIVPYKTHSIFFRLLFYHPIPPKIFLPSPEKMFFPLTFKTVLPPPSRESAKSKPRFCAVCLARSALEWDRTAITILLSCFRYPMIGRFVSRRTSENFPANPSSEAVTFGWIPYPLTANQTFFSCVISFTFFNSTSFQL